MIRTTVEMDDFLRYLLSAKAAIGNLQQYNQIHIVLGNESCDLDSAVSALVFAYFLKEHVYKEKLDHVVIPILNINLEELPLRTETCYAFEEVGINNEHLVFRDDIDLKGLHQKRPALLVTLVDHHVLAPKDEFLKENIVGIFDHRPLDKDFKKTEKNLQLVMQEVGSCSSLIAQEIFRNNEKLLNAKIAVLIYYTIIYDTIALKPEHGRVRPLDIEIAKKLERKFDLPEDQQQLFDYLWKIHTNVENLTSAQILVRDLKIVDGIPLPGLPTLVDTFLKRPDSLKAIIDFALKRKANIVVLIGLEAEDVVKRDVAVFFKDKNDVLLNLVLGELKNGKFGNGETLQLQEIKVDVENLVYFQQKNVKATRKKIIPLVKAAVEKNAQ